MRDNNEGNGRLKKLENGGRREINFFLELLKLDGKKNVRERRIHRVWIISIASILERCVLSTEEREIIRERKIISTVLLCVKSANRLFESQPFQLARNITPLFCSKR